MNKLFLRRITTNVLYGFTPQESHRLYEKTKPLPLRPRLSRKKFPMNHGGNYGK